MPSRSGRSTRWVRLGALASGPARSLRQEIDAFGGSRSGTLVGEERPLRPRRLLQRGAGAVPRLQRQLSSEGETCHPSDNLGAVLSAAEFGGKTCKEFLTALAVSYQVQCRLSDVPRSGIGVRPHDTRGVRRRRRVRESAGTECSPHRPRPRDLGRVKYRPAGDPDGRPLPLKGLAAPTRRSTACRAAFLAMRGSLAPGGLRGDEGVDADGLRTFDIDWSRRTWSASVARS